MRKKQCAGPHHWLVTIKDSVESGTCRNCGARRIFDSERLRFSAGTVTPKSKPTVVTGGKWR